MSGKNRKKEKRRRDDDDVTPSPASRGGDRTLSSAMSELSFGESRCSSYARQALHQMRNSKDPFDNDSKNGVKEFHRYVTEFPPDQCINLEECSLLLQETTKVLAGQVKCASKFIAELAAFVTNTAKPDDDDEAEITKERKGRKKKDELENGGENSSQITESQGVENSSVNNNESSNSTQETSEASLPENATVGSNKTNVGDSEASTLSPETSFMESIGVHEMNQTSSLINNETGQTSTLNESSLMETNNHDDMISDSVTTDNLLADSSLQTAGDTSADSIVVDSSNSALNTTNSVCDMNNSTAIDNPDVQSITNADGTVSTENSSATTPPTRRELRRKNNENENNEIPRRKSKLSIPTNPPHLTSIIDIDNAMETDEDSDYEEYPPILYPEVDLWGGTFDPQADPDAPPPAEIPTATTTSQSAANNSQTEALDTNDHMDHFDNDMVLTQEIVIPSTQEIPTSSTQEMPGTQLINAESAASTSTAEPSTTNPDHTLLNGVISSSTSSMDFPSLSPEDQQEIQNCINQLHYLPFTCELSTDELARTFRNTVDKLETIFTKYKLPFNRHLLTAASAVCANMVNTFAKKQLVDAEQPQQTGDNSESFSQESHGNQDNLNSNQTIFERTKEKSFAESRATMHNRLKEMQRLIVPKYIQLPLIQENTPEFFRRVKQFEQKMKKVLADEEKKESFDVSKYEIEVLAATAREAQEEEILELDESGDETITSMPDSIVDDSMENQAAGPFSPPIIHQHPGMVSPSSTSNTPSSADFSRKWVPLSNVFNHMKKFDRNECARHFYAVLALLSSQNLDMNYDRHFSKESAALVTPKSDHSQDSKYPRGVKIMTSRCPDADKEEIYVTALASKSCNETFRDLISQEMNQHQSPTRGGIRQRSESNVSNFSDHNSDSDSEFVSINCTNMTSFSAQLFGRKRKKRTD